MIIDAAKESRPQGLTIVDRLGPADSGNAPFIQAVRQGLESAHKSLPWTYFYDEKGSQLFEEICALPEYYLTRAEDAILHEHADAMVAGWDREMAPAMVELGSGSASKTRRLIAAALRRYGRLHYLPIDVSHSALVESAHSLVRHFSNLRVSGYVSSYQDVLGEIAESVAGPKLWVFLGSSLGNYDEAQATELLRQLAFAMAPDDRLLLGTDLAKDAAVLEAAYDDAAGVTAAFNLNLLARINRELKANFALDQFRHRAVYRPEMGRVEMQLVSLKDQVVQIREAGLKVSFREGETIHTENSHKYTQERLQGLASVAGFVEEATWSDPKGWFQVQRWRPVVG
ncbi:L-histidine N(alpha)-methyltransferase [Singulisphaera sp. PoT]|uniref:L-histidine N(alpha)-methyltransferase n=1 Tax=Singulisphaera sp. PoT TaxID=3411797 RepID=UPI003BF46A45